MNPEVKASTAEFCQALTARAQAASKRSCWFEPKPGPWYIKVLLHDGAVGVRDLEPGTFCFVSKDDSPFDWSNYRVGDVMAPKTSRKPWKMDTGAVANVLEPDGGISYRVIRYGSELGLW